MKYLLVIVLALVVCWLWRLSRRRAAAQSRRPASPTVSKKETTEIVACGLCKVHLPRAEALIGRDGFYCSEAHRRESGA